MPQINISVPEGLKSWIDSRVAGGRYSSPSDYIRELVRQDQAEAAENEWLQAELDRGLASGICEENAHEVIERIIRENRTSADGHRTAA